MLSPAVANLAAHANMQARIAVSARSAGCVNLGRKRMALACRAARCATSTIVTYGSSDDSIRRKPSDKRAKHDTSSV